MLCPYGHALPLQGYFINLKNAVISGSKNRNMGIEFNDLYVTLDPETIESIAKSEFISQEFCTISRDTVKTDRESWAGTYTNF
jgi:hypothetical protein